MTADASHQEYQHRHYNVTNGERFSTYPFVPSEARAPFPSTARSAQAARRHSHHRRFSSIPSWSCRNIIHLVYVDESNRIIENATIYRPGCSLNEQAALRAVVCAAGKLTQCVRQLRGLAV